MAQGNNHTHDKCSPGSMSAFDRLPKALRRALAESDHNWNGEQLYRARKTKRYGDKIGTIKQAIEFIRAQDARKHNQDAAAGLVCGGQRGDN